MKPQRIAVIGAGIVGVATARALVEDGHAVTVLERRGSLAAEGSFAPAGLLAPGVLALGGPVASLVDPPPVPGLTGRWQRWRATREGRAQRRREQMARLALESQAVLGRWFDREALPYEHSAGVGLRIADETGRARLEAALAAQPLAAAGSRFLDREAWRAGEPDLAPDAPGSGLLFWPGAEMVNVRQIAQQLREQAEARGARFLFGIEVQAVEPGRPLTLHWLEQDTHNHGSPAGARPGGRSPAPPERSAPPPRQFDAVVLCSGAAAPLLPGPALPLVREAGLSLTLPLRDPDRGPVRGLIDADGALMIARLGDRLRVAGLWHRPTGDGQPPKALVERLYRAAQRDFPSVTQTDRGQIWAGIHLGFADGLPRIGASESPGLWLNLGHGRAGWALACGSAQRLADALAGRDPAGRHAADALSAAAA